jgi:predicted enzyme related to lactoylglutathione lyase
MHVNQSTQRTVVRWWRRLLLGGLLSATAITAEAGRVAWVDLLTSGVPAEEAVFYTKVLGWTMEQAGTPQSPYVILSRAGRPVAGVAYRGAEEVGAARNRWLGFFAVAEPAAAAARAEAAGAVVLMPARCWPGRGEQVVLADAEGATFGLMETVAGAAEGYGGWGWATLVAVNPEEEVKFYADLLGAAVADDGRTPMFSGDFLLSSGGRATAGVTALPQQAGRRAGWLWFVQVAEIDAVVREVERQGGRVLRKPGIDLMGGRLAVVADPRGAVFGLIEPTVEKPGAAKPLNSGK